ncbi:hypothetical protein M3Y96_00134400 [Aphelenchoides besseyi]|nr:hypothetical protein M3Y96_00134400 [Aphelenchoides besseyi]
MGATRHRFHNILFEAACITQIVALSLAALHTEHEKTENMAMWMATLIMCGIGSFLLLVGWIMHGVKKLRRNIPPLYYILIIALAAILGIIESILSGILAFNGGNRSDIMVASMGYSIISTVCIFALIALLVIWPPISDYVADIEKTGSVKPLVSKSSIKSTQKFVKKPNSRRSQKSTKKENSVKVYKSEHSHRKL